MTLTYKEYKQALESYVSVLSAKYDSGKLDDATYGKLLLKIAEWRNYYWEVSE